MNDAPISLGVLLVHGIGLQRRGDTLVSWVDALVETINVSTKGKVSAQVDAADVRQSALGGPPAHATVRIVGDSHSENWLFAEAYWADTFGEPSYQQLVSWSFRAVPWALATHSLRKHTHRVKRFHGWRKLAALLWAQITLIASLFLAPLVVILLLLLLVIGLIPLASVRRFVASVQRAMSATAGDSMVLLESPVRAAAIRSEFLGALNWLRTTCQEKSPGAKITVVAHSQGAAIALEALGGIDYSGPLPVQEVQTMSEERSQRNVDAVVTFGAGINKLSALRSLAAGHKSAGASKHGIKNGSELSIFERDPIRVASACLWLSSIGVVWMVWLFATEVLDFRKFFAVLGGIAILWLIMSMLAFIAPRIKKWAADGSVPNWVIWSFTAIFLVVIGVGIYLAKRFGVPLAPFVVLMMFMPMLLWSVGSMLSKSYLEVLSGIIRIPSGIEWFDFYSSRDPVPNGPIEVLEKNHSFEIWNQGSLIHDHVTYWENRDGFVLRLTRILSDKAGSCWHGVLPEVSRKVDLRSRWRARWRNVGWGVVLFSWLVAFYVVITPTSLFWLWVTGAFPDWLRAWPFGMGWFEPESLIGLEGIRWSLILLLTYLTFRVPAVFLHSWARTEQNQILGGGKLGKKDLGGLILFYASVVVIVAVAAAVGLINSVQPFSWTGYLEVIGTIATLALPYGLISFFALNKWVVPVPTAP